MLTSFVCNKKTITCNLSRQDLAKILWEKDSLVWVDLDDPSEFESEILIELFNFHPLAIEDCLNDSSEPKIDDYEDHLFLVVHAVNGRSAEELKTIELDIFVSKNYVVTFHKQPVQSISQFRDLLAKKSDTFMTEGSDMLLHTILDRLVDRYLPVIADQERKIDIIEEKIFSENKDNVLPSILKIQKDVIYLKRIIAPQQETVGNLSRSARSFIKPKNMVYFKDIYDHLFRYYQMTEQLHSLLTGILQVYFSHVSTKLNEVIKTMTVIATIGIPPTVIASIYGMNFKHMPELYWEWGYFFSLGLMTLSSAIILIYMKIKKWF